MGSTKNTHQNITKEIEFFNKTDELITEIIIELKKFIPHVDSFPLQNKKDIERGYIKLDGKEVLIADYRHSILVKGFPAVFLENVLNLLKEVHQDDKSIFTQFAFRTLLELCTEKATIIFDNTLEEKERHRFKVLYMLTDYFALAIGNESLGIQFKKLFEANIPLFTEKQKKLYEKGLEIIKSKDNKKHNKLVIKIRRELNAVGWLIVEKNSLNVYKYTNNGIRDLKSSFAHILHGNIFQLRNLFSEKKDLVQHRFRHKAILLIALGSLLQILTASVEDEERTKSSTKLMSKWVAINIELSETWKQYSATKEVPSENF